MGPYYAVQDKGLRLEADAQPVCAIEHLCFTCVRTGARSFWAHVQIGEHVLRGRVWTLKDLLNLNTYGLMLYDCCGVECLA